MTTRNLVNDEVSLDCTSCGRFFHLHCVGLGEHQEERDRKSWACKVCIRMKTFFLFFINTIFDIFCRRKFFLTTCFIIHADYSYKKLNLGIKKNEIHITCYAYTFRTLKAQKILENWWLLRMVFMNRLMRTKTDVVC